MTQLGNTGVSAATESHLPQGVRAKHHNTRPASVCHKEGLSTAIRTVRLMARERLGFANRHGCTAGVFEKKPYDFGAARAVHA